ncbi:MAG: DUF1697 domain-containing protein [Puniceicoccaceae bacterium]|nr:MAG: DUF1697 domain-containing protein [Puniceicoccaceae bacterium]
MPAASSFVALLRGINVGGHATVPMKQLRAICSSLGWGNIRTLLNSGNVVFTASGSPSGLEAALEEALVRELGLDVAVVVRGASDLLASTTGAPFEAERKQAGSSILVCFSKSAPQEEAAAIIHAAAKQGELAVLSGGLLWICFPHGMGRSKITPAILNRACGSPATGRNWNTVAKLLQLTAD